MKALLIPVKDPSRGKTRLSDFFTLEERRRLAWAMLEDVIRAAAAATKPDRVVVVTSFDLAVERASKAGFEVLIEQSQTSESASVDWASRLLKEQTFDSVMRLPADVPLVRAEDIDELLDTRVPSPGALLVPSHDGTGTNAIIRTPPDIFCSRFGPNSLELHRQEAARAGAGCVIVHNERIGIDIDEPTDVRLFMERGRGTETFRLLSEIKSTSHERHESRE
jgi:2-phospho-L-lactate guanylyltransferase